MAKVHENMVERTLEALLEAVREEKWCREELYRTANAIRADMEKVMKETRQERPLVNELGEIQGIGITLNILCMRLNRAIKHREQLQAAMREYTCPLCFAVSGLPAPNTPPPPQQFCKQHLAERKVAAEKILQEKGAVK